MRYAIVENSIVTNIIWLHPANASNFPNAVPMNDYPAGIGDTYDGEYFYRDGERIHSLAEQLEKSGRTIAEYESALTEIEIALGAGVE